MALEILEFEFPSANKQNIMVSLAQGIWKS